MELQPISPHRRNRVMTQDTLGGQFLTLAWPALQGERWVLLSPPRYFIRVATVAEAAVGEQFEFHIPELARRLFSRTWTGCVTMQKILQRFQPGYRRNAAMFAAAHHSLGLTESGRGPRPTSQRTNRNMCRGTPSTSCFICKHPPHEHPKPISHDQAAQQLRRAGFPSKRFAAILSRFPDPIDLDRDELELAHLQISAETLISRLGGSP